MTTAAMHQFLLGMVVMGCAVAGLFFLRFWRKTRDRLFLVFAVAFWLLGLSWTALAFMPHGEARIAIYIVRLLAFAFILVGIVDKNRHPPRTMP